MVLSECNGNVFLVVSHFHYHGYDELSGIVACSGKNACLRYGFYHGLASLSLVVRQFGVREPASCDVDLLTYFLMVDAAACHSHLRVWQEDFNLVSFSPYVLLAEVCEVDICF